MSGDDATALGFLAHGGDGCISVTSNAAPGLCRDVFLAWRQGETAKAQRLALVLAPLTDALFRESNPVPLKYALSLFGVMSASVRLPLVGLSDQAKAEVTGVLARLCDRHSAGMVGKIGSPVRTRQPAMTA